MWHTESKSMGVQSSTMHSVDVGRSRFQQGIADTSAIPSVMSRHIPNAWRTFGQVHNRIHHCTSPSLLMKFYIVVVCDVSRSEYTHALGHYLGGGQVGSTLWSLGIGAVDDDAPMDILPEIEEEVPKLVSTFRNPHFRWFGRDVMDWITMIHRGRPWALFSGVVLRARRGETTWLFFSLRLSFGMIGSSGWYCYQN